MNTRRPSWFMVLGSAGSLDRDGSSMNSAFVSNGASRGPCSAHTVPQRSDPIDIIRGCVGFREHGHPPGSSERTETACTLVYGVRCHCACCSWTTT